MSNLKVGLIGCGHIAQAVHLPILMRLPEVKLTAFAETDPQRRSGASHQMPGAFACDSYQELLKRPDVEAVIICLPNALHAETAIAALNAGKHVYLEKPLATNLDDGRRVLTAWRRSGLTGMIGFNYRFNPLYQAAKQYVQSNRLGELVSVRSVFSSVSQTLPEWKRTRRSGGGVLLDLASHHVDLLRFFFAQEVQSVFAEVQSQRSEGDSTALQLRLANGLLVQSFFSLNAVEEDRFETYGQAGKLMVDRHHSTDVEVTKPKRDSALFKRLWHSFQSLAHSPYALKKMLAPAYEPSFRAALTHFVAAARNGQPVSPDFWDGYCSLAVIEAAEESARTKQIVSPSLN